MRTTTLHKMAFIIILCSAATLVISFLLIVEVSRVNAQADNGVRTIVDAVVWSPDDMRLAIATGDYFGPNNQENLWVRVVDMTTQEVIFTALHEGVAKLAWNQSGEELFIGSGNGAIQRYNVLSGALQADSGARDWDVWYRLEHMSLSPDATRIAILVNSLDGPQELSILDAQTLQLVTNVDINFINTDTNPLRWVEYSPNGLLLAAVGWDGSIRIWNAATLTLLKTLIMPSSEQLDSGAWSPDSTRLAVGDSNWYITVWDVQTDQVISRFRTNSQIYALQWHPDGRQIVASNSPAIWDMLTGQPSQVFPGTNEAMDWNNSGVLAYGAAFGERIQIDLDANPLGILTSVVNVAPLPTPTPTPTATETPTSTPTATCTITVGAGDTAGLIAALNTANGGGTPSRICLTQSTYTLTAVDNTSDGANGLPSITSDITLLGNGATLTRDPVAPAFRLFHVAANGSLTLENLTVSGGLASGAAPRDDGGAVYNRGTFTLTDSTITNNSASADGGGVYSAGTLTLSGTGSVTDNAAGDDGGGLYTSGGTLTVTDGTIAGNSAGDQGGGIRSVGTNMTLVNASITGNSAINASGGGLYATSTTLTISGGQISGNSANSGGGLYLTNSPSAAQLDNGVQIINNTATSGGGMYLSQDAQAALTNATVSGNQASSSAAGIWAGGALTLTNSTVSNNGSTAQPGSAGGIRAAGGTLTVIDSIINGNRVHSGSGLGAGVYVASAGVASVSGGEVSSNSAYNGGGLYVTGSLSLGTTISENAAANHGGGMYISSGAAAVNYSTFNGNTAGDRGGGIINNATLQVDNSVFNANTANGRAGAIYLGSVTGSWVHTSCVAGNTSPNTSGVYSAPSGFNATDNWWGAANGPSGAGSGSGDAVNSNVTFSPFITTECPSSAGAGGGEGLTSVQTLAPVTEATPVLAPVRLPVNTAFAEEVGWRADGTWVLDTLTGHTSAPSWAVNTVPRDQESLLEMSAPVDLRRARSPRLTFWERGQIASNDLVVVEVLPQSATEWVVVDSQTSVPADWTQHTVDLTAYRGQTVRLRVRVVAGGELGAGETSLGLWLDDLIIENR